METNLIKLFEDQPIRSAWDEEKEEWYFSIVDVIRILTDSPNPQTYWRVMKIRLKDEGNETVTNCNALKMTAADGKKTFDRCCGHRTAFTDNTVDPVDESGAVQGLACPGWAGANRGNDRPGAYNRPRTGNIPEKRVFTGVDKPAPSSYSGAEGAYG